MKNEIEVIAITATYCGKENTIIVNIKDFFKWQNGALVEDAFPYLSTDERELLIFSTQLLFRAVPLRSIWGHARAKIFKTRLTMIRFHATIQLQKQRRDKHG